MPINLVYKDKNWDSSPATVAESSRGRRILIEQIRKEEVTGGIERNKEVTVCCTLNGR
jgi:hypothetical protein